MQWRSVGRDLLGLALLLICMHPWPVWASIHQIHAPTTGCRFTERMYADGHGPWGMGGHSMVTVNATIRPLATDQVVDSITIHRLREYFDFGMAVLTYSDVPQYSDVDERSICARNLSDPEEGNRWGYFYGEFHPVNERDTLNVSTAFYPATSGVQVVLVVTCWKQKSEAFGYPVSAAEYSMYPMSDAIVHIDATVAFQNPYGYLPALLYGLFPFNGGLSLLYGFVDLCFVTLINRHRGSVLRIQYMLLTVLLLATGESVSWFVTYKLLNESGQTVCCPYPPMIIMSTVVKILAGMVARIATTLICLGYGVVRPQVTWHEAVLVTGLGVCYFISVGALEISHLMNQSDGDAHPPAMWELLVIATNACFAGWIFISLSLTRKNLAQFGQTVKLHMYDRLKQILYAYVIVSFFLMGLEGAVYSGTMVLDWQWIWIIWAGNRLLMFCILLVITVIWRPRATSWLYSQMDQLPTETPTSAPGCERREQRSVPTGVDTRNEHADIWRL